MASLPNPRVVRLCRRLEGLDEEEEPAANDDNDYFIPCLDLRSHFLKQHEWAMVFRAIGVEKTRSAASRRLHTLWLDGNDLGRDKTVCLSRALAHHPFLEHLGASGNKMDNDGAVALAESLSTCVSLTVLELSGNNIGNAGAHAIATHLLTKHSTLKKLYLKNNKMDDDGIMGLGMYGLAVNRSLSHLDLSFNEFGNDGLEWLGQGLATNRSLRVLWVHGNHADRRGVTAFSRGMARNPSLHTFLADLHDTTVRFYLYRNKVGLWSLLLDTHDGGYPRAALWPILLSKSLSKYEGVDLCFDLIRNKPSMIAN